jgi:hypothetical protein
MVRKMVALLVSSAVLIGGMNAALAQGASAQPANTAISATPNAKADGNSARFPREALPGSGRRKAAATPSGISSGSASSVAWFWR